MGSLISYKQGALNRVISRPEMNTGYACKIYDCLACVWNVCKVLFAKLGETARYNWEGTE